MGQQIIRQPDGKFAVYSTVSDGLCLRDATEAEVIAYFVDDAKERAESRVRDILAQVGAGHPERIYFQFAIPWAEAVANDGLRRREGARTRRVEPWRESEPVPPSAHLQSAQSRDGDAGAGRARRRSRNPRRSPRSQAARGKAKGEVAMKCHLWFWGGDEAAMFEGHEIAEADALRLARDEMGWDPHGLVVKRVFVVRDPDNDHKGDADEAYKKCEAGAPGALALTLVTS